MTREIKLTKDKVALVSDEDYEELSRYSWQALRGRKTWYAYRKTPRVNGKRKTVLMHRQILNATEGMPVDHRDGNGLNNQRDNVRYSTHAQNKWNTDKYANNACGFKGVRWDKQYRKWVAYIKVDKERKYLGRFVSREDAARAYDAAALKYHGEYAYLNFQQKAIMIQAVENAEASEQAQEPEKLAA